MIQKVDDKNLHTHSAAKYRQGVLYLNRERNEKKDTGSIIPNFVRRITGRGKSTANRISQAASSVGDQEGGYSRDDSTFDRSSHNKSALL